MILITVGVCKLADLNEVEHGNRDGINATETFFLPTARELREAIFAKTESQLHLGAELLTSRLRSSAKSYPAGTSCCSRPRITSDISAWCGSESCINEIGGAHWCTLCTLSRSMGMVYTVCTAGLHAPQI